MRPEDIPNMVNLYEVRAKLALTVLTDPDLNDDDAVAQAVTLIKERP